MTDRDVPGVDPLALPDSPELALAPPPARDAGPRLNRLARFLAGVGVFSLVQGLTQLLALGAGILWVRILPTGEYALYTLANSILALAAVLTDLGAGSALQHFFHRHQGSADRFARYLAGVRSLRRWLALGVLPVLLVMLATQTRARSVTLALAAVLLLVVLASSLVQQESTIRLTALRLLGRWRIVYRAEVALAAARFGAALLALVARAGSALLALAANLAATLLGTALASLGRVARPKDVARERREVLRFLAPIVPDTVYYALQGQLVIWLAALAGTATQIAEIGALTRVGLLFAIPQNLAVGYFVPKLAGRHTEKVFRASTMGYAAFLAAVAGLAVLAVWIWPAPFLALLGSRYQGLEVELRLVVAAGALGVLGAFFAQVNRTRGWTKPLWVIIAATVLGQTLYAMWMPLSTTASVLGLGVVASGLLACGHAATTAFGLQPQTPDTEGGEE